MRVLNPDGLPFISQHRFKVYCELLARGFYTQDKTLISESFANQTYNKAVKLDILVDNVDGAE